MQSTTVRQFEGGLNVADSDLNMEPRFARVLDNVERAADGSLAVRPGTRLFANFTTDTSDIVNIYYFNSYIIAVQYSGNISRVAADGTVTPMYLPSTSTPPWPPGSVIVTFTIFNSDLIICNGRNKPLIIPGNPNNPLYMTLQYLQDLATLSNINTPIGKFVVAHAQYLCIAGVETSPSTLYISSRGTSGTFQGDPPPNDSISLDLGSRISLGSSAITGLVAYRDKLIVTFERGVLPLNLGVYTGDPETHAPTDDGFIEEFGCLAHRSLVSIGDDTFFCDNVGVNSIERIAMFNTLRPQRASYLIDPDIIDKLEHLTPNQITEYVFAVYDMRNKRYMLFVPVFDDDDNLIETIGYSYTDMPLLKVKAWARLRGWTWRCATRTQLQNVIFGNGAKLYSYNYDGVHASGSDETGVVADFVDDTDYEPDGQGIPVDFTWEMPWADFNRRMMSKQTKYIHIETTGRGVFTVDMYADRVTTDVDGNDAPLLSMDMVAGDSGGYGVGPWGSSPYGGGRVAKSEMLQPWPAKFNLAKFKFSGSTTMPIRFISITLQYQRASIRR